MTVSAGQRTLPESHFTEGEPDLEPPEELAISELDEQTMLEEDLDNEDLLEQDVDEDALEAALDDLVHDGDIGDNTTTEDTSLTVATLDERYADEGDEAGADDGDEPGADDVETDLDVVLLARLDLVRSEVPEDGDEEGSSGAVAVLSVDQRAPDEVAPCGADEFVCRTCFLVRKRVQLADAQTGRCHDCVT